MFWNSFVLLYSSRVGDVPGCLGNGDVTIEVETDVPASKRRAVVTRRLIPLAGDGIRPPRPDAPVLERSRELLEQAFDNGFLGFPIV